MLDDCLTMNDVILETGKSFLESDEFAQDESNDWKDKVNILMLATTIL